MSFEEYEEAPNVAGQKASEDVGESMLTPSPQEAWNSVDAKEVDKARNAAKIAAKKRIEDWTKSIKEEVDKEQNMKKEQ